ncbi:MAG: leucyl aminopeptidase [Chloroflexi bacterium]|jgi:leucyl aminopeptidase|nr:MAG: leucyl aminopeptidase [Chloroflexota bacterium]
MAKLMLKLFYLFIEYRILQKTIQGSYMNLIYKKNKLIQEKADAYVISIFNNQKTFSSDLKSIDIKLKKKLTALLKSGDIKTEIGKITTINLLGEFNAKQLFIVGLGDEKKITIDNLRTQIASVCRTINNFKLTSAAFDISNLLINSQKKNDAIHAIAEAIGLSQYQFTKHKTHAKDKPITINDVTFHGISHINLKTIDKLIKQGLIFAQAANLTKDLANEPANYMTPSKLAEIALDIADKHSLQCEIINKNAAKELKMGSYLSVASGSNEEPKFIILKYQHKEATNKPVAIVGKGITFDTGGISLKPSAGMDEMKGDMSGAATVLGVMQAIGELKPKLNIIGIAPCTENMPGGKATKPGDVVYAMDGQSIEVLNTDAEGRLVLADALSYAVKEKSSAIIDIATLTGAMTVSLGSVRTGVFSNNDKLFEKLVSASTKANEPIWRFPLDEAYGKMIVSNVADIKNVGEREAGSITAAKFLEKFIGNTPWIHMDIAGVMTVKQSKGEWSKGMSGNPVRTLVHLLLSY